MTTQPGPGPRPLSVVADVDTGIDDALALTWLAARHRAGRLRLTVTASAGNTTAALAARNSREVLRVCGLGDLPVTCGAAAPREVPLVTTPETHGPEGLGHWIPAVGADAPTVADAPDSPDEAVRAWRDAAPDHIIVAGPATTLAHAVDHAPDVLRSARVTLMTGAFLYPGNTTPTAEWNAWVDPHALAHVVEHWPEGAPLPTVCPLNVTERVLLRPERLDRITAAVRAGGPGSGAGRPGEGPLVADFLDAVLRFYFEFHDAVGVGYAAQIHDLAAAQVALGAVGYSTREATVAVGTADDPLRGTTVADDPGSAGHWGRPATARILTDLDPEVVFDVYARDLRAAYAGGPDAAPDTP
ncbi:nucleoside hydrolase [Corynebacterium bovis]|uniref:nucleoside hydrolase n=1 Tax=Corynebacterium bovis TaxID=36808 RepID=UPI0036707C03